MTVVIVLVLVAGAFAFGWAYGVQQEQARRRQDSRASDELGAQFIEDLAAIYRAQASSEFRESNKP